VYHGIHGKENLGLATVLGFLVCHPTGQQHEFNKGSIVEAKK